jgi:hypothetical protein
MRHSLSSHTSTFKVQPFLASPVAVEATEQSSVRAASILESSWTPTGELQAGMTARYVSEEFLHPRSAEPGASGQWRPISRRYSRVVAEGLLIAIAKDAAELRIAPN